MPVVDKKTANKSDLKGMAVANKVRSYANDPFFIKKAEEAKETLKRVGLPGVNKK